MSTKAATHPAVDYEADFYAWTQDQAEKLRARRQNEIDWDNVAEEIDSVGRSQRKEIRHRLVVLLHHLLKWEYQPERRSNSWRASIGEARAEIRSEIDDSPSLRGYPDEVLARQYWLAGLKAAEETNLSEATFPEECPYSVEQILDPNYFPGTPS
ncbi:DUF29 domain-containing protein [Kaistia dalseonensis]|uniref:DUF29 domain-containing protein n=1 Tax=Kaistia dalseonensis TaxID=410840 RepID=A0ABU0H6U3_9HYPH|nr:DUF29 domain-containing protein [Kaistia dalseonensis]MCX5494654.1 DUF29 domain-containing protein [Kaistia dalseonensis]MDQ0437234.1 hypothetical protein [Kaistia dalseonensis]